MTIDQDRAAPRPNHERQPVLQGIDRAGEMTGAESSLFVGTMVERADNIVQLSSGVESELAKAPDAVKSILVEVSAGSTDYEAASMAIERLFEGARGILRFELTFLRTLTNGLNRCGGMIDGSGSLAVLEFGIDAARECVIWSQFDAMCALFGRVQALSGAGNLNKPEHVEHRQAFFDELERIIQDFVNGFVGNSSLIAEVRRSVIDLQTEFNEKDALDERL